MDANLSPIVPRQVVTPARDKQPRRDDRKPFQLPGSDAPPGEPEDEPTAPRHEEGDLSVGHAENDESGRRLDVTA